jgi:hypothetical protein
MPSAMKRVSEGRKSDKIIHGPNSVGMEPAKDNPTAIWTIRDLDGLEDLRGIWKSWPGSRDSDLDFFCGRVRSRGSRCEPHVIVLARNARPECILIGLRERRRILVRLGHFTICQPEVNVLEFVYGGLRGNASEETCSALVWHVIRSLDEGDADLALFEPLDVESPLYRCALQLPRFASLDHSCCTNGHWLMNFPKGLDDLLMSLGRSQRSKLRRKYNKLFSGWEGKAQVRSFRSLADLEPAISDMEEIASRTDKRLLFGVGFFDTPQIREQMAVAAEKGWLRIYILYLDEKPAAFWRGTVYERCLQADDVGHDPVWREFSPGICLFLNILEDLREEDIKIVDFCFGDIQFKQCFGGVRRIESRVHIYAPTLRGLQLNLLETATQRATDCAKFLLRRTPCLQSASRALRTQLLRQRRKRGSIAGSSPN